MKLASVCELFFLGRRDVTTQSPYDRWHIFMTVWLKFSLLLANTRSQRQSVLLLTVASIICSLHRDARSLERATLKSDGDHIEFFKDIYNALSHFSATTPNAAASLISS